MHIKNTLILMVISAGFKKQLDTLQHVPFDHGWIPSNNGISDGKYETVVFTIITEGKSLV